MTLVSIFKKNHKARCVWWRRSICPTSLRYLSRVWTIPRCPTAFTDLHLTRLHAVFSDKPGTANLQRNSHRG